jgi:RNA polymerase sigma-70 factor (ECF subfamily)
MFNGISLVNPGKDQRITTMSDTGISDSASNAEDRELVEKLKRREPTAVVELYNAYFDRIYWLVFSQVGGNQDATQDIVQETFLAAFKSANRFHGRSKVYTWLYSIANKKVADFYRRRKREAKHQTEPLEDHADESQLSEAETESEEAHRLIQQTLSSLPLHYKQVLLLKYVEEMPVAEISQTMGRSPKSVEGLLTRARRELRNRLTAQNEG